MTKLINLAKNLDFKEEFEYFDYCIDSYINGNFSQCRDLFTAMDVEDQKDLIRYIDEFPASSQEAREFYFGLL